MFRIPLIVRGEVIDDCLLEFNGRRGEIGFCTPDVEHYIDKIVLQRPSAMADLYSIDFESILDYLSELSERLNFTNNAHMQEAFDLSCLTSGLSESILRYQYENIPYYFQRDVVEDMTENLIGIDNIEGWVEQRPRNNNDTKVSIRAFGSRAVHIIAGNAPVLAATTIIRNAITRSDGVIKLPSNDPLTATAIALTMAEMAPEHPLTRHLSVAYWKGGNESFESKLYQPRYIEKIIAWGGYASIQYVTKYLQPGIDLITLDPKHSASIVGKEAFENEQTMREVAAQAALDIASLNQEACVNARVIHAVCGTNEKGLANVNRWGEMVYEAMQKLPDTISTQHKAFDPQLREELDGLRLFDEDHRLIGGVGSEGAIIISQIDEPVDFSHLLACRVANIVPVDDVDTALKSVNAYTQTIGIYPETLKQQIRDNLAWQGAQRIVSLGGAVNLVAVSTPQDGIEPVRRMCKWIVDERHSNNLPLEAI